jgi:hypothetical protein
MTTLALSRLIHETPSFLHHLGARISAFLDGIAEARLMAHQFKTLSQLSDAELARRGLKREDIPQAVLKAAVRA